MKERIAVVIYANPDYYPPVMNAVSVLKNNFNLAVIARNQDKQEISYSGDVKIYRLGKPKTAKEKEIQHWILKTCEYAAFVARTAYYVRFLRCKLIYTYDIHGFLAGFIASRIGRKIPIFYHNLDMRDVEEKKRLSYAFKYLEAWLCRYSDRIIFSDINRARYFQKRANLKKIPDVVMNAPLLKEQLPPNRLTEILKARGFDIDTKVVLYQGAIHDTAAIPEVMRSMVFWPVNTVLVMSGYVYSDFSKDFYREAEARKVLDRIIYLPYPPYPQIFSYTAGAYVGLALYKPVSLNRIFVAGASNKIFEYLSMGIPVITNDSPYFREVLDSSYAYFINPESIEEISGIINSVFSELQEYRRKSQAARQIHIAKFNYEAQFNPICESVKEIVKKKD